MYMYRMYTNIKCIFNRLMCTVNGYTCIDRLPPPPYISTMLNSWEFLEKNKWLLGTTCRLYFKHWALKRGIQTVFVKLSKKMQAPAFLHGLNSACTDAQRLWVSVYLWLVKAVACSCQSVRHDLRHPAGRMDFAQNTELKEVEITSRLEC